MESHIERLQEKATDAALNQDWSEAINLNHQVLELDSENIDGHLALAYAYMQKHDYKMAARFYKGALKLQPGHPIAQNNIEKIEILLKGSTKKSKTHEKKNVAPPTSFINVLGKTKITHLVNVGQSDILAKLEIGEEVFICLKKRRLEVRSQMKEYIGALPDDISKRLIFFIEEGSFYSVYIKSALKNSVEVFIREEKKGKPVRNFLSFPANIQDDLKLMMKHIDHTQPDEIDPEDDGDDEDDIDSPETIRKNTSPKPISEDDDEDDVASEITDIESLANFEDDDYIHEIHGFRYEDDDE